MGVWGVTHRMDSEWEGELQEVRPVSTSTRMDTSALSKLYLYVVKYAPPRPFLRVTMPTVWIHASMDALQERRGL